MRCLQDCGKARSKVDIVAWVVDSSVLLDIRQNDPEFGLATAECLVRHLRACSSVGSAVDWHPRGDLALQEGFQR
jgi:hypothetical protein